MAHMLNLSRAARLVGASRAALQKKIRDGELASFDGQVSADALLAAYPEARLDVDASFERITQIKEQAFGKRVRERTLPSQEILSQRLFAQSQELAELRLHLQRYHALVLKLEAGIRALSDADARMSALAALLDDELARVLGEPAAPAALEVMDDMLKLMSSHVLLHPSGREFFVEGADTLLEAGLKAGIALNYGCSNGNCGLCKARVASGEVRRVRHHDYLLTEAEKQAGYTLPCSYAPVSDLVLEALEAAGPDDLPEQQLSARVKAVQPLGDDVLLLHLQTPRTRRLRFLAGQSVTLGFHPAGSAEHAVASCPCDERNLQFHIPRDAGSSFAEHLFAGWLKPGDTVSLWGPWGSFVLDDASPRALAFIACDTGFAPVKSVIEHALARESAPGMRLYWLAGAPGGHYLANLCRAWAEALDEFAYTALARAADEADHGAGRGVRQLLADVADIAALDVYLAGPAIFVDAAARALRDAGLPARQLRATATA